MNPDVITLVDDVTTPETKKIEDNKNANEIYNDIKKVLNKVTIILNDYCVCKIY